MNPPEVGDRIRMKPCEEVDPRLWSKPGVVRAIDVGKTAMVGVALDGDYMMRHFAPESMEVLRRAKAIRLDPAGQAKQWAAAASDKDLADRAFLHAEWSRAIRAEQNKRGTRRVIK